MNSPEIEERSHLLQMYMLINVETPLFFSWYDDDSENKCKDSYHRDMSERAKFHCIQTRGLVTKHML